MADNAFVLSVTSGFKHTSAVFSMAINSESGDVTTKRDEISNMELFGVLSHCFQFRATSNEAKSPITAIGPSSKHQTFQYKWLPHECVGQQWLEPESGIAHVSSDNDTGAQGCTSRQNTAG